MTNQQVRTAFFVLLIAFLSCEVIISGKSWGDEEKVLSDSELTQVRKKLLDTTAERMGVKMNNVTEIPDGGYGGVLGSGDLPGLFVHYGSTQQAIERVWKDSAKHFGEWANSRKSEMRNGVSMWCPAVMADWDDDGEETPWLSYLLYRRDAERCRWYYWSGSSIHLSIMVQRSVMNKARNHVKCKRLNRLIQPPVYEVLPGSKSVGRYVT